ncbi:MAG: tRNA (adenosine(37)-N6)-threonylcarbamoyltransferase complex dimerization subunit type 1 TsaB [Proteobacteria bacterium]|nr:tRNA (adenosine(37)-N6)-threonylcarbamoyltransferase complex dimerization subunit type 1 TsaB [Pseudomonadota bacterium]
MKLLALDASTQWLSVAAGDGTHWHARRELAGHAHSERLLPLAREVLDEAALALSSLDAIAFGAGPGSFTGVRIACGAAQGLALGTGVPLVPVDTLLAVAHAAWRETGETHVLAALDARMAEVYVAAYRREAEAWHTVCAPSVMPPAALQVPPGRWTAAGDAYARYPELAMRPGISVVMAESTPDAVAIGELAAASLARGVPGVAARDAAPFYVRDRVALTAAERAAGERLPSGQR